MICKLLSLRGQLHVWWWSVISCRDTWGTTDQKLRFITINWDIVVLICESWSQWQSTREAIIRPWQIDGFTFRFSEGILPIKKHKVIRIISTLSPYIIKWSSLKKLTDWMEGYIVSHENDLYFFSLYAEIVLCPPR